MVDLGGALLGWAVILTIGLAGYGAFTLLRGYWKPAPAAPATLATGTPLPPGMRVALTITIVKDPEGNRAFEISGPNNRYQLSDLIFACAATGASSVQLMDEGTEAGLEVIDQAILQVLRYPETE